MRVGEQAQVVLKKVEALTETLNKTDAAAGREDRAVLRSHRADRGDDPHGRDEPGARHDPRAGRPRHLPLQRPHRADRRRHDPVRAALLVHLPGLGAHPGQPAVDRRDRLRDDRRRRGRDGGEHLPRAGRASRSAVQPDRSDPQRRARRRAADLLRDRRDHRGVPADLRADRAVRPPVPSDGRHDVLRAARLAALLADAAAGPLRLLPARQDQGAGGARTTSASAARTGGCCRPACVTARRRWPSAW